MAVETPVGLEVQAHSSWRVGAVKPVDYEVKCHAGLLQEDDPYFAEALMSSGGPSPSRRRLVVIDENVDTLYGAKVRAYFRRHDIQATVVVLPVSEPAKTWDTTDRILEAMDEFKIDRRREPVVVIGGGVLCDIVGFAASIYRRGTPYVRVPTTLIGIVDAGVGVKTGVNHRGGKNRIGTYANPKLSLLDRQFLATIPERHLANGMAEILKVALVRSRALFDQIDTASRSELSDVFTQGQYDSLCETLINDSIHLMLEELQPNLWEHVLERWVKSPGVV